MSEPTVDSTKVRKRGIITIPKLVRKRLALKEGDLLLFYIKEKEAIMRKAEAT